MIDLLLTPMSELLTADSIISLIVLIVLEVVLGIDNVIFVSIILNRLPALQYLQGQSLFQTILQELCICLFGRVANSGQRVINNAKEAP